MELKPEFTIQEGDTLIFCFGEIDCRCHVSKHVTSEKYYKEIIKSLVDKYIQRVEQAVKLYSNLKVCLYNIVPAVRKIDIIEDEQYPLKGSDEERKQYVYCFNEMLKERCSDFGYTYFDVFDKYVDHDGFLNRSLSDGSVHIQNGIYLQMFIEYNHLM